MHNVTDDAGAAAELEKAGGKNQAPCLLFDGKAVYEAGDICTLLANSVSPLK